MIYSLRRLTLAAALSLVATLPTRSFGDTITQWTFEGGGSLSVTDNMNGPSVAATTGTGTATGVHASSLTDWSSQVGNGSANSLSVNTWTVGDYFQFSTNTLGFSGIKVAFDQTGSPTGPANFKLQYNFGSGFTDFPTTYTLGNISFSSGSTNTNSPPHFDFDLSAISGLNNAASVAFRLVNTTTVAINGGTVGTGGTGRVDNFTVATVPTPEAANIVSVAMVSLFGLAYYTIRRRSGNVAT